MKVLVKVISSRLLTEQEIKEDIEMKGNIAWKDLLLIKVDCVWILQFLDEIFDIVSVLVFFFFLSKMHLTNTLVEKQEAWIHIGKNKNFH